mmetsp:Transcript_6927/g.29524  ORF Transcript_6927/g.29524 Transcript_6927/m.29524 type:complete len:212 (+) Transcript_6927:2428-3063(+)
MSPSLGLPGGDQRPVGARDLGFRRRPRGLDADQRPPRRELVRAVHGVEQTPRRRSRVRLGVIQTVRVPVRVPARAVKGGGVRVIAAGARVRARVRARAGPPARAAPPELLLPLVRRADLRQAGKLRERHGRLGGRRRASRARGSRRIDVRERVRDAPHAVLVVGADVHAARQALDAVRIAHGEPLTLPMPIGWHVRAPPEPDPGVRRLQRS